nr:SPOR domain-containing protein [uncultured Undibacterium sp.]
MSLDSLFKQNNKKKNDTEIADDQVSGEFRSRSEEDSLAASESSGRGKAAKANKRPTNSRKSGTDGADLPEKKRARRRLIGAVALVLAAIIVLPMVFDSEPKPGSQKISIEIPSKDTPLATTNPVRVGGNATVPTNYEGLVQGIDKSEEIVAAPKTSAVAKLDDARNVVKVESATSQKSIEKNSDKKIEVGAVNKTVMPNLPPVTNKVTQDTVKKTEAKVDAKAETKTEVKKEDKDDAARALALLEGRALPVDETKDTAKPTPQSGTATGSFTVQVAALNSPEKIRELQAKLKAASITSYTQKITTKTGEVSRIRVGPFANKAEAEKIRAKLVKLGLNGSLVPN